MVYDILKGLSINVKHDTDQNTNLDSTSYEYTWNDDTTGDGASETGGRDSAQRPGVPPRPNVPSRPDGQSGFNVPSSLAAANDRGDDDHSSSSDDDDEGGGGGAAAAAAAANLQPVAAAQPARKAARQDPAFQRQQPVPPRTAAAATRDAQSEAAARAAQEEAARAAQPTAERAAQEAEGFEKLKKLYTVVLFGFKSLTKNLLEDVFVINYDSGAQFKLARPVYDHDLKFYENYKYNVDKLFHSLSQGGDLRDIYKYKNTTGQILDTNGYHIKLALIKAYKEGITLDQAATNLLQEAINAGWQVETDITNPQFKKIYFYNINTETKQWGFPILQPRPRVARPQEQQRLEATQQQKQRLAATQLEEQRQQMAQQQAYAQQAPRQDRREFARKAAPGGMLERQQMAQQQQQQQQAYAQQQQQYAQEQERLAQQERQQQAYAQQAPRQDRWEFAHKAAPGGMLERRLEEQRQRAAAQQQQQRLEEQQRQQQLANAGFMRQQQAARLEEQQYAQQYAQQQQQQQQAGDDQWMGKMMDYTSELAKEDPELKRVFEEIDARYYGGMGNLKKMSPTDLRGGGQVKLNNKSRKYKSKRKSKPKRKPKCKSKRKSKRKSKVNVNDKDKS